MIVIGSYQTYLRSIPFRYEKETVLLGAFWGGFGPCD